LLPAFAVFALSAAVSAAATTAIAPPTNQLRCAAVEAAGLLFHYLLLGQLRIVSRRAACPAAAEEQGDCKDANYSDHLMPPLSEHLPAHGSTDI
jgi:hypothetical protein